ncbi:MAG: carboxylesterase family protein [bacterium]
MMKKTEILSFVVLAVFSIGLSCNMFSNMKRSNVRYKDQIFSQVNAMKDILYSQAFNPFSNEFEMLYMDAYWPAPDTAKKRWVLVFAHGGGYCCGDKSDTQNINFSLDMAKRGYVVFNINYRLLNYFVDSTNYVPGYVMAGADLRAAVRYVRSIAAQRRLDPDRITVFGSSAGGGASLGALYDQSLDSSNTSSQGFSAEPDLGGVSAAPPLPDLSVIEPGEPKIYIQHCIDDTRAPFWVAQALTAQLSSVNIGFLTWFVQAQGTCCHTIFRCRHDETVENLSGWIYSVIGNR